MIRAFATAACLVAFGSSASPAAPRALSGHVRVSNDRILEAIDYASRRSPTFRRLIAVLDESETTVYIEEGRCADGHVAACLHMMPTSPGRYVLVHVNPREYLVTLVRHLAHELQHAGEIARTPGIVDADSVRRFYQRIGFQSCLAHTTECWETREALQAETAVLTETSHVRPTTADVEPSYFGTWTLDVERSSFTASSAPTKTCLIVRDQRYGLISTVVETLDADGTARREAYVYRLDGIDYQTTPPGQRPRRTIAVRPLGSLAAEFTVKQDGEVVATGRRMLTSDRNTLIEEIWTADAQRRTSVLVWVKQSVSNQRTTGQKPER